MKKTIRLNSYPPKGWTPKQWASAERVSERFDALPLNPDHWHLCYGGYIGRAFNGLFIGIEPDGYAHT